MKKSIFISLLMLSALAIMGCSNPGTDTTPPSNSNGDSNPETSIPTEEIVPSGDYELTRYVYREAEGNLCLNDQSAPDPDFNQYKMTIKDNVITGKRKNDYSENRELVFQKKGILTNLKGEVDRTYSWTAYDNMVVLTYRPMGTIGQIQYKNVYYYKLIKE